MNEQWEVNMQKIGNYKRGEKLDQHLHGGVFWASNLKAMFKKSSNIVPFWSCL